MPSEVAECVGLSLTQLEYELRWAMRQAPPDPAKKLDYLMQAVVALIHKNNLAIAQALAGRGDAAEGDY